MISPLIVTIVGSPLVYVNTPVEFELGSLIVYVPPLE